MSDKDTKLLLELADESRREFLKKLGKGVAMATSGLKPDIKKVVKAPIPMPPVVDRDPFDLYDAVKTAFQDVVQRNWTGDLEAQLIDRYGYGSGARRQSEYQVPYDFQDNLYKKMLFKILGHKYASSPGGPSALAARDRRYRDALLDNAEEYGDEDEAIDSTIATLEDTFDFQEIIANAYKVAKAKGFNSQDLDKYLDEVIDASVEADQTGNTDFETPEPHIDMRDYQETDYASGPHMNSFKPEMSFKQYFLSEMGRTLTGPHAYKQIDDEKIKQLYEDGFSSREIGEELGVSHWTILDRLNAMGIERRPSADDSGHRNLMQLDDEKIKQMYKDGYTSKNIGEELGVSYQTIIRRLKAMGVPVHTRWSRHSTGGSDLRNPSQMRTRNITGPGNVGGAHQTFSGSGQTVKTNLPGPRRGQGH